MNRLAKQTGLVLGFLVYYGFIISFTAFGGTVQTSFVCKGRLHGHYFEVRVNKDFNERIELWSSVPLRKYSYDILSDYWDSDKIGLLSAIDCFLTYENHRGCIRNVSITGSFLGEVETVSFESCGGYHQGCD